MNNSNLFHSLKGGLIVSCQAGPDEPLHGSEHMAAMARAAEAGGAVGIRANSPANIAAIRTAVKLPVIGIYKDDIAGFEVHITPTLQHARQVAQAGAHIIAIDATLRPHPDQWTTPERIRLLREETGCPIMADISNFEEGLAAEAAGADLVATTLSGYTPQSPQLEEPDFELLRRLVDRLNIPVIAEGRIATPDQALQALELGAYAVVIGSAITRPQWITAQFVKRMGTR